jgi:hypothetical protein
MTQAERVLNAFGGPRSLAAILKAVGRPRSIPAIQRWTYPRSRGGSDGYIPGSAWDDLFLAAAHAKVVLSSKLLDPRPDDQLDPKLL